MIFSFLSNILSISMDYSRGLNQEIITKRYSRYETISICREIRLNINFSNVCLFDVCKVGDCLELNLLCTNKVNVER